MQPWCVQMALQATAEPSVGCAMMIGEPSGAVAETEPPTGTSARATIPLTGAALLAELDAALVAALLAAEVAALLDGAALLAELAAELAADVAAAEVAAGELAAVVADDPQAARKAAPAPAPATWRARRRVVPFRAAPAEWASQPWHAHAAGAVPFGTGSVADGGRTCGVVVMPCPTSNRPVWVHPEGIPRRIHRDPWSARPGGGPVAQG
ncbi:hypothetical protein GCM10009818_14890 [Nakamurella flavida]